MVNTEVRRDMVHGRPQACTEPEVKRSTVRVKVMVIVMGDRVWLFMSIPLHSLLAASANSFGAYNAFTAVGLFISK